MGLFSSILGVSAVWAAETFIEMARRSLHVKDGRPEIGSRPVSMDLIEASSICVNLRSSAVGFSLRSLCSFAANPFYTRYETVFS
jgi:hypothetical protein